MPHMMSARGGMYRRRSISTAIRDIRKIYIKIINTTCVKYSYCKPGDNKFIEEFNNVLLELSNFCKKNLTQFSLGYTRYSKRKIYKGEEHLLLFTRDPRRVSRMLGIDHYIKLAYDHINELYYIQNHNGNQVSIFNSFMPSDLKS